MRVGARPAKASDLPRLVELLESGILGLRAQRGGLLAAGRPRSGGDLRELVASSISDAARAVMVGTLDDQPVGLALVHTEALSEDGDVGVIDTLYVEPAGRGVGVGEGVMSAVLDWLASRGCVGVDSSALPGDRATKSFLESAGFKARLIVLHREVGT